MSQQAQQAGEGAPAADAGANPFAAAAAMWPWNLMGGQPAATPAPAPQAEAKDGARGARRKPTPTSNPRTAPARHGPHRARALSCRCVRA